MQQKVENDHRWHHKTKMAQIDIDKITSARFFQTGPAPENDTPLHKLWYAMNQKFHKKQLQWEWRWQKLWNHIYRLQDKLAERNHTIQTQRDTIATQAEMIAKQDDLIKQLEAMLGVQNAIEERKGDHQQ